MGIHKMEVNAIRSTTEDFNHVARELHRSRRIYGYIVRLFSRYRECRIVARIIVAVVTGDEVAFSEYFTSFERSGRVCTEKW